MGNRTDDPIEDLRAELDRYPPDRYPVQRATALFHLGVVLLDAERAEEALDPLVEAAALFDPTELPTEHAKATNMAGVALRTLGRTADAVGAFAAAVRIFDAEGEAEECGAALYNLGLAERDRRDLEAAEEILEVATRILEEVRRPAQAAAAARELGATLLERGEHERAEPILARATQLAEESGDLSTLGSCANVHGLALLASGSVGTAVEVLRHAAGAHPRTVRPEGHAMAKANLALAYEQAGDVRRARLAARQARATPDSPPPVADQAAATLDRLPDGAGDLIPVLLDEPHDAWPGIVGEELARWSVEDEETRRREAETLAEAFTDRSEAADLAEAWLGGLLELPPGPMERLIASFLETVGTLDAAARASVERAVSSGMVRFHGPQWMRLKETFNRLADELGLSATWG